MWLRSRNSSDSKCFGIKCSNLQGASTSLIKVPSTHVRTLMGYYCISVFEGDAKIGHNNNWLLWMTKQKLIYLMSKSFSTNQTSTGRNFFCPKNPLQPVGNILSVALDVIRFNYLWQIYERLLEIPTVALPLIYDFSFSETSSDIFPY